MLQLESGADWEPRMTHLATSGSEDRPMDVTASAVIAIQDL